MVSALNRASEERSKLKFSQTEEKNIIKTKKERTMHKSWFTWLFVAAAVAMVFITFNYQGGKDAVPLSEIFPDEEVTPVDVEYEFVQEESAKNSKQEIAAASVVAQVQPQIAVEHKEKTIEPNKISLSGEEVNFTVQIASFKDQKKAEESLAKIRKNVPSAYIASRDLGKNGVWYRIYAGQFELRSQAEVSLNDIKKNYNDSFIISPK
jgi:cell division septation protein DedD